MSNISKPELVLQELDEWMLRWRHYQSEQDFNTEVARVKSRQWNYAISGGVFLASGLYTAAPATINRVFGPPHFFDFGVDAQIKDSIRTFINSRRRFTPNGLGRIASIFVPTFLTVAVLEHRAESARLNTYLKAETVFGEQARRRVKTGKIEEFLAVNVKGSLPAKEAVVYAH
jgi:hypothetical protein